MMHRLSQIARKTRFSSQTIAAEFLSGRLPGVQIGRQWSASFSDLCKWLGEERAEELFGDEERASKNRKPVEAERGA